MGAWLTGCLEGAVKPLELPARRRTRRDAPAGLRGEAATAATHTTLAYVATLRALRDQIAALDAAVAEQLAPPVIRPAIPRSGHMDVRGR